MQVTAVINSVAPRAAGGKTIYDIDLGGQVYSTFDPEGMRIANDHVGQLVTAEVDVKTNGQYQNYWFNGIPGAAPVGPPALGPAAVPTPAPPSSAAPRPSSSYTKDPDTEARISFLSVLQSASRLVGSVYEGAGPESLVEAEDASTTLAKVWFKMAMQAPAAARQAAAPPPLQAVPEQPAAQPEQTTAQDQLPDW